MKTEAIQKSIINNYSKLSKMANIPNDKNHIYSWGLRYKGDRGEGYINQLGLVERYKTKIAIEKGSKVHCIKKPFYLSWKFSLQRINVMLEDTIANLNNKEVVTKNVVSFLRFIK